MEGFLLTLLPTLPQVVPVSPVGLTKPHDTYLVLFSYSFHRYCKIRPTLASVGTNAHLGSFFCCCWYVGYIGAWSYLVGMYQSQSWDVAYNLLRCINKTSGWTTAVGKSANNPTLTRVIIYYNIYIWIKSEYFNACVCFMYYIRH